MVRRIFFLMQPRPTSFKTLAKHPQTFFNRMVKIRTNLTPPKLIFTATLARLWVIKSQTSSSMGFPKLIMAKARLPVGKISSPPTASWPISSLPANTSREQEETYSKTKLTHLWAILMVEPMISSNLHSRRTYSAINPGRVATTMAIRTARIFLPKTLQMVGASCLTLVSSNNETSLADITRGATAEADTSLTILLFKIMNPIQALQYKGK